MFNVHLLQRNLTVEQYETLCDAINWFDPVSTFNQFPSYTIARCPLCLSKNIEKIDTYSLRLWGLRSLGTALFDHRIDNYHCDHFALVQPFFHFHGIWPTEAKGQLTPEVPHVIGHLLEKDQCQAVIHALPICRIENETFIPRYTLFIVTYFSEKPSETYNSVIAFNADYVEPGIAWPFIAPPEDCDGWWDLKQWVTSKRLFWVDANDPDLGIYTSDTDAFPYSNIEGRTWPYLHTFPFPLPKKIISSKSS